jgi:hypothetical protein
MPGNGPVERRKVREPNSGLASAVKSETMEKLMNTARIALAMLLLIPSPARAWMRPGYEDAVVVERSELIVVAHLKEGSIQCVPHEHKPGEGMSREFHVALVISEVLKGKCEEKEIPIILHYGLTPVVGGYARGENFQINLRRGVDYPADIIEIVDTGDMDVTLPLHDVRQENLWFLRRRSGEYGWEPGTGKYGIVDPQDLQPLKLKDYFLAYMAADPEKEVGAYAKNHPDVAGRAQWYLDHQQITRILAIEDLADRYKKLLPFLLKVPPYGTRFEVMKGMVTCGKVAGQGLREVFDNPQHAALREDIIGMWEDMGYTEAASLLITLLEKHERFWATQELEKGWWNNMRSDRTRRLREIYGEDYKAVAALEIFADSRARDVLEATRNRWKVFAPDFNQIVESCDRALQKLSAREGAAAGAKEPVR